MLSLFSAALILAAGLGLSAFPHDSVRDVTPEFLVADGLGHRVQGAELDHWYAKLYRTPNADDRTLVDTVADSACHDPILSLGGFKARGYLQDWATHAPKNVQLYCLTWPGGRFVLLCRLAPQPHVVSRNCQGKYVSEAKALQLEFIFNAQLNGRAYFLARRLVELIQ